MGLSGAGKLSQMNVQNPSIVHHNFPFAASIMVNEQKKNEPIMTCSGEIEHIPNASYVMSVENQQNNE